MAKTSTPHRGLRRRTPATAIPTPKAATLEFLRRFARACQTVPPAAAQAIVVLN